MSMEGMHMNNVARIVQSGVCTGCNACAGCEHIHFEKNQYGFSVPVIDDHCTDCGTCIEQCLFDPDRED